MGLFPFDIAKMTRIFGVFFDNYLNKFLVSDESDEVVFFIPMSPIMYSDRHKKSGHTFRYVHLKQAPKTNRVLFIYLHQLI